MKFANEDKEFYFKCLFLKKNININFSNDTNIIALYRNTGQMMSISVIERSAREKAGDANKVPTLHVGQVQLSLAVSKPVVKDSKWNLYTPLGERTRILLMSEVSAA